MRQSGESSSEIADKFGISAQSVGIIARKIEARMQWASEVYGRPVFDPIVYGVWHTFTHEGRETNVRARNWRDEPTVEAEPVPRWDDREFHSYEIVGAVAGASFSLIETRTRFTVPGNVSQVFVSVDDRGWAFAMGMCKGSGLVRF
jgi:hypothetical protein